MNIGDWINKYSGYADRLRDGRVLYLATTETMTLMQERIWMKGELTDGSKLSYKEDYEVYIYKPPFPRQPDGKGKTGRKIKGQWEPTYLAAKASQDRADLPFELTGDMRIDWLGGPTPTPVERGPFLVEIVVPQKTAKKIEGLTKQKGEFIQPNQAERDFQNEAVGRIASQLFQ